MLVNIFGVEVTEAERSVTVLSKRGEDLRYVTEHFQDLQSAGLAPFWAFVLVSFLSGVARGSTRALFITVVAGVLVAVISYLWGRKWYRNRYGIIVSPLSSRSSSLWQGGLAALIFGLCLGVTWFRLFDNGAAVSALIVATVPVLLPRCFDTARSTAPRLRKVLHSASLTAVVALSTCSFFGGLDGRWLWATGAGCCLLLAIYDHWLLDHILRPGALRLGNNDER